MDNGIEPETAVTGQALDLGDGAALRVLHAGESGAALLLEWRDFSALLPVGMDEAALKSMLDDPTLTPVTALLLAEGGAAELNPPEWIAKLRPQVVLLSSAAPDRGRARLPRCRRRCRATTCCAPTGTAGSS